MTQQESGIGLKPEVVDIFARGLYHLAKVDGIDPSEISLIEEFLSETGATVTMADLERSGFDPKEAAEVLETTAMRHIFVRTAIALVKADGVWSEAEIDALGDVAETLGLSIADFCRLELEASQMSITGN
ncbi:MAG: TerB family tellurite resistance protein [Myxococcales bacterium]|nr:TerB family tellurite resistance protein [Myxococcales bacterium]MCB9750059.1 TerB family tellurite resistance protein [Myxococcales bacterium]